MTAAADPFAPPKRRLSVSQLKEYERCPYAWYLSRRGRAWRRPAAWLPQGTAVHAAIEAWERSGRSISLEAAQDVFRAEYTKDANEACTVTPNLDWWYPSGPYRGEADLLRRFKIGLEQVEKYVAYATRSENEVVWVTPDGEPAIELHFDIDLDGVLIQGYIDAVIVDREKSSVSYQGGGERYGTPKVNPWLVVRDHKTGNNPGDDFQLGVYSVAIQEMFGTFGPYEGDYWMARAGKPTHPFDLRDWTREAVAERFRELEGNIQNERFDPKPDPDVCRFCSVSLACEYAAC